MKGLLIKDFKLLKSQKNFFLLIAITAIGMSGLKDSSFAIGYMAFFGSLFTISSISYDEFDNGNAFLFSLPITRKSYVIEKYSFGLLMGSSSWLLATLIVVITEQIKNTTLTTDIIMMALIIIPAMIFSLAVMLPFQFKFGGEKSRIALIAVVGMLIVIGIIIVKIANIFHIDLLSMFDNLPAMSMRTLIIAAIGIAVAALLLSFNISVKIMNKKEF